MLTVTKQYTPKYEKGGDTDFIKKHVLVVKPDMGEELKYPKIPTNIKAFMPIHQQKVVNQNIAEFQDILSRLDEVIDKMPSTYETDGTKLKEKTAWLHYFYGDSDWYIFEKDKGDPKNNDFTQNQMFGYAILGGDWQNAEAGYVSIDEINSTGKVELDFHFTPVKFGTIMDAEDKKEAEAEKKRKEKWEREPEIGEIVMYAADEFNPYELKNFFFIQGKDGDKYTCINKRTPEEKILYREQFDVLTSDEKRRWLSPKIIEAIKGDSVAGPVSINELLTGKNQHQINEKIRSLIKEKGIDKNAYSAQELQLLEYYEGSGGYGKEGESGARLLDQFFTPDAIIKKMWGLAIKHGFTFKDAVILEPSVGIGRFLKYIPASEIDTLTTFEVDDTAWIICNLLYPFGSHVLESFESIFFKGKRHIGVAGIEKFYDLVIGNPPYREYVSKYAPLGEKKATDAHTFDQYFIMRGIDVLKPGGLLIYIIPSSFMFNKVKYNAFKEKLAKKAELLEAYRLPSGVFGATEVTTDIIVLKKKA